MSPMRMIALALVAAGVLGLAYGGFTYTRKTHEAKIGNIELSVRDKRTVNVPLWAGVGAIVLGGVLLAVGKKE
jgi:TRAP-type C4-dicarboxylate transport system permease small subunit